MDCVLPSVVEECTEQSDATLLARLRAKDPEVVVDIYDRYGRILYAVLLRMVHDSGVAEDLVQETIWRCWHKADQLSAAYHSAGPWLSSVARHLALDYLKSSRVRRSVSLGHTDAVSKDFSAECGMEFADRGRILAGALQILAPQQRRVIELAYFEGLSQTAIAEHLCQPLGTIKSWTRMALHRLRDEISRTAPSAV